MAVNQDYLEYVLDQLSSFGEVHTKKMFGGIGIFHEGLMFAMVAKGALRLKADDINRPAYEQYGFRAFMSSDTKKGLPYFEVPIEILEDKDELKQWVTESFECALRNRKKKK